MIPKKSLNVCRWCRFFLELPSKRQAWQLPEAFGAFTLVATATTWGTLACF